MGKLSYVLCSVSNNCLIGREIEFSQYSGYFSVVSEEQKFKKIKLIYQKVH